MPELGVFVNIISKQICVRTRAKLSPLLSKAQVRTAIIRRVYPTNRTEFACYVYVSVSLDKSLSQLGIIGMLGTERMPEHNIKTWRLQELAAKHNARTSNKMPAVVA